jgi:hypothetical protein
MSARLSVLGIVVAILAVAVFAAEATGQPSASVAPSARHPVVVDRHPAPRVLSGATDRAGQPATIACGTCHAVRPPDPENRSGADLDQFHQGLNIVHGTNTCLSCHDAGNYDGLKLADGRKVAFEDSITLCSQCHGPQRRDYDHGAHGGMNGYWDLSRGGRVRNTCVNCHDPHVPKYQPAIPMPRPRDRFQAGAAHE